MEHQPRCVPLVMEIERDYRELTDLLD